MPLYNYDYPPPSSFAANDDLESVGLTITVTKIVDRGDEKVLTVEYDNKADCDFKHGEWVGQKNILIKTDQIEKKYDIDMLFVGQGGSLSNEYGFGNISEGKTTIVFTLEDCPGEIQTIHFDKLTKLDNRLPEKEFDDILIYDISVAFYETVIETVPPSKKTKQEAHAPYPSSSTNNKGNESNPTSLQSITGININKGRFTLEVSGLSITVSEILYYNDFKAITVEYDNRADCEFRHGEWVGQNNIIIQTDQTEKKYDIDMLRLNKGGSLSHDYGFGSISEGKTTIVFALEDCPGEIQTIHFDKFTKLNDNGLPEKEFDDILIYDISTGVQSTEYVPNENVGSPSGGCYSFNPYGSLLRESRGSFFLPLFLLFNGGCFVIIFFIIKKKRLSTWYLLLTLINIIGIIIALILKPVKAKCPRCNAAVNQSEAYCPNCGHTLINKCPNCGATIKNNGEYCTSCGNLLSNDANSNCIATENVGDINDDTKSMQSFAKTFLSIENANTWLSTNSGIAVTDVNVMMNNGKDVSSLVLQYTLQNQLIQNKYRIAEYDKNRYYVASKAEDFCNKWREDHPHCRLIKYQKFSRASWIFLNGLFARRIKEKYVVLYTIKQ